MPARKQRAAAKPAKRRTKALKTGKPKRKPAAAAKAKARAPAVKRKPEKAKPRAAAAARRTAPARVAPHTDPAVDAFMRGLAHPQKAEIETVRRLLLGIHRDVREGIKWNAPSFLTSDHFATFNFLGREGFRLILHTGAKVKETAQTGMKVADPTGMLAWQAKDRCTVTILNAADLRQKLAELEAILRQWVDQLP